MNLNQSMGVQSEEQEEFCIDVTYALTTHSLEATLHDLVLFKEVLHDICNIEHEEFTTSLDVDGYNTYSISVLFIFRVAKENKKLIEDSKITEFFWEL